MMKPSGTTFSDDLTSSTNVNEAAAAWAERKASGMNPQEEAELEVWLAADVRHGRALKEQEAFWRMATRPQQDGQGETFMREVEALATWRAARLRRRKAFWTAAGIAAAAAVLFIVRPYVGLTGGDAASSVAVRPDRQVLPDGSVVELNAGTEIALDYTTETRGVRLLRGEALFQVAKNPDRPFIVTASGVDVRAVGTAFTVALARDQVNVLVTEGRVAVQRPNVGPSLLSRQSGATADADVPVQSGDPAVVSAPNPEPIYLSAGARLAIPTGATAPQIAPQTVTPAQIDAALAWRSRRVEFTLTPLAEAVEMLNGQNQVKLVLGDRALAELRLTGVFWTDDPQGFSRLVKETFGLGIEERTDGTIVLRK